MARELIRQGVHDVSALEGGWQAWLEMRAPVQAGETVPVARPAGSPGD